MLSCHHENSFSAVTFFIYGMAYQQSLYIPFADCLTYHYFCDCFFEFISLICQIFVKFFHRIRIRMGNIQLIVLVAGTDLENQSIVHSSWILSRNTAFFIRNLMTRSLPSFLDSKLLLFILSYRIDCWCHAIVEKWVWFCEIDNRESVVFVGYHIFDREIEPLVIADWIYIVGHHQIILEITNLHTYIYTLKAAKRLPLSKCESNTKSLGLGLGKVWDSTS